MRFLEFLTPIYFPDFSIFLVYCSTIAIEDDLSLHNPMELTTSSIDKYDTTRSTDHNIASKRIKLCISKGEMFGKENISCSTDWITDMSDEYMRYSPHGSNKYNIFIESCYMMNSIEWCLYRFLSSISRYKAP